MITTDFKHYTIKYLDERYQMIVRSIGQLDPELLWEKPNAVSNSMGNLLLHLSGNIRQYVISGLGGAADTRNRPEEFNSRPGSRPEELLEQLGAVIASAKVTIQEATEEDLLREYEVQGFRMQGIGILVHVVEHLSYHTGQIAYFTKLRMNEDLGFYKGTDLDKKNKK